MILEPYPINGYPDEGWPLPDSVELISNVPFSVVDGHKLHLEIVRPKSSSDKSMPAILMLHGGGWASGNRRQAFERLFRLAEVGYFCISVDYRLTDVATFPAQIQDVKSALRWLRDNSKKYNVDSKKIGIWGGSAGGHLAALLGVTANLKTYDSVDLDTEQSAAVQAVVCFCPPIDFNRMSEFPENVHSAIEHESAQSCEGKLLGGPPSAMQHMAEVASPLTYITENHPPFFIMHGQKDEIVPVCQSHILHDKLKNKNESMLKILPEGKHGGDNWGMEYMNDVIQFFDSHLKTKIPLV